MIVRRFNEADTDTLIQLWADIFPDDPPHNKPAKMLHQKLAVDDLIFVVEQQGDILGACIAGYDGHRGWLYAVGVLPEQRRRGVGEKLVRHAIAQLKQAGCDKVNLQIRIDNHAVKSFYESLGFSVEDRLSMGVLLSEGSPKN